MIWMLKKVSLLKTISYRILSTISCGLIVFCYTGSITATFTVSGTEFIVNTVLYYYHERIWVFLLKRRGK